MGEIEYPAYNWGEAQRLEPFGEIVGYQGVKCSTNIFR
jgi:hypothetical protein